MATKLFLRGEDGTGVDTADTHRGTNSAKLDTTNAGWFCLSLATTAGASLQTATGTSVTGPTAGIEIGSPYEWLSPPVSADVTISGAITGNIWASETNMSANVAINFVVDVVRATDNAIVQIVKSARTTEVAVTTRAVNNFTATPGAGVTVNRGDRIRARIFGDDAGTMASGFTFDCSWNGGTAAADGDTYLTFTEDFAFESAPSGTTLYLTDVVSDVATASVDRELWTSRGSGVVNDVTNTTGGWVAPIQVTDTAGGTVVDWFSKQLVAFTLGGMAQANIRGKESAATANASLRLEIASVDSDGTNPSVWGSWGLSARDTVVAGTTELDTTERAETFYVSGDDLAISDGQRLRLRLYVDDKSIDPLGGVQTVTTYYNGTSAGASGDSYVILPQSVSEFTSATSLLWNPAAPTRYRI